MKFKLILMVVFVVTWKSLEGKFQPRDLYWPEGGGNERCYIDQVDHEKKYEKKEDALDKVEHLKTEKYVSDIKVLEENRREIKGLGK